MSNSKKDGKNGGQHKTYNNTCFIEWWQYVDI